MNDKTTEGDILWQHHLANLHWKYRELSSMHEMFPRHSKTKAKLYLEKEMAKVLVEVQAVTHKNLTVGSSMTGVSVLTWKDPNKELPIIPHGEDFVKVLGVEGDKWNVYRFYKDSIWVSPDGVVTTPNIWATF